jgi:two-component system cell cycle response regulator DivK
MRKRVLVVDDFEDIRRMLRLLLEQNGFDVVEAKDGYEAVQIAVAEQPDLILMDLAMPIMDGIQATQAIRKHRSLEKVPILAITAYGEFYNDRARDVGCTDVIQKPVDIHQFRPLVNEYIN